MDNINGIAEFLCSSFVSYFLLTGLVFASSSHKVLAQSNEHLDIAYEYQGNLYLTGFENNEIIYNGSLTNDPEGGNVSDPSWSSDGRYLMFTLLRLGESGFTHYRYSE